MRLKLSDELTINVELINFLSEEPDDARFETVDMESGQKYRGVFKQRRGWGEVLSFEEIDEFTPQPLGKEVEDEDEQS